MGFFLTLYGVDRFFSQISRLTLFGIYAPEQICIVIMQAGCFEPKISDK